MLEMIDCIVLMLVILFLLINNILWIERIKKKYPKDNT